MARSKKAAVYTAVHVPLPDPRPYVPPLTLPANREADLLCLHDQVVGFMMHWLDKQHLPCPKDKEWCAGCRVGNTPRWTGFIGVISLNTRNRFIARIPASAFRNSGVFKDRSDARLLKGTVFTSYRFGQFQAKNNPCVIEIAGPNRLYPVAKPFHLLQALSRYWRIETCDILEQVDCPESEKPGNKGPFKTMAQREKEVTSRQKEVQS